MPQSRMDSATRVMRARTPDSRSAVPIEAVEVLGGHDVGGGHGPVGRDFHVLLLEDDAALEVLDDGVAELPDDLVVGGDAGAGKETVEGEAGGPGGVGGGVGRRLCVCVIGNGRHGEVLLLNLMKNSSFCLTVRPRVGGHEFSFRALIVVPELKVGRQ